MKFNPKLTSKALFTIVGGAVLINPVFAQEQGSEELEEVVVTGLRGSLKASMDIKRDAIGVVDAISAEDIGKFPDTNLAESLQRIPGVSIDRQNGEGSQVTVRGFGPAYNLVTLNGRTVPTAEVNVYGAQSSYSGPQGRSFDFSNIAAEAVSAAVAVNDFAPEELTSRDASNKGDVSSQTAASSDQQTASGRPAAAE